MRIYRNANRKVRIEMLPLIDIVFLLLVFFIYAMLSMAVHRGLPVVLPTSKATQMDQHLILAVTIKSDGRLYLDKEPIILDELGTVLRERAEKESQAGVLLFADKTLPYQRLFEVLDQIRLAGLTRISLQAESEFKP